MFADIRYVAERTREIGVRRALGAPARRVLASAFVMAAFDLNAGVAIGVGAGVVMSRLLTHAPSTIAGVDIEASPGTIAVLAIAVAIAAGVPVRRALRLDPVVASRHE